MNTTTTTTQAHINWFDGNLPQMSDYEGWIAEEITLHVGANVHVQLIAQTGCHILTGLADDVATAVNWLGQFRDVIGSSL